MARHADGADGVGGQVSLPYFRKWVDRWRASPRIGLMSLEQRGAYDDLLCISWQIGPLPKDPEQLAMLLRVDGKTFRRVWKEPLLSCWIETPNGLINERLEEEREWAKSKTTKAKKAAAHRWDGCGRNADALHTQMRTDRPCICHTDTDTDPEGRDIVSNESGDGRTESSFKEKEEAVLAGPTRARRLIHWHPKPVWKKGHPSLEKAHLMVDAGLFAKLVADFPHVDVEHQIRRMEHYARENPGWARRKKDWRRTLGNWLRNADDWRTEGRSPPSCASPQEPRGFGMIRDVFGEGGDDGK